jgi:acetoin utilization protein AcuB
MIAMHKINIRQDLPVLKTADTLYDAINIIEDVELNALPVLSKDALVGVVSADDLQRYADTLTTPSSQTLASLVFAPPLALRENSHPLEAVKLFRATRFDLVPVVGNNSTYLGAVTRHDSDTSLIEIFGLTTDGILMEVEVQSTQFRLSDFVRLLEQNNAQLLSIALKAIPSDGEDDSFILITLNLHAPDAYRLQRTLERYGYAVTYNSHNGESLIDDSSIKAQEFIRYLEV